MLAHMRSATFIKAMMIIVSVAFVGLMVFDWGADISGGGGASVGDPVGDINGVEISYQRFQDELAQQSQMIKSRQHQRGQRSESPRLNREHPISSRVVTTHSMTRH